MSEPISEHVPARLHYFAASQGATAVVLPFALGELLEWWGALRTHMIRRTSPAFSRDEWAYLITFLDPVHLRAAFSDTFGDPVADPDGLRLTRLARPRGPVALWLPNNVSLLGPLTLILLSLTGNPIRVKGGSRSEDLVSAFLGYIHDTVPGSPLADYLAHTVRHEVFDRHDPRNADMAAEAQVRVVFGSDEAAQRIHALPHPVGSVGFSFSDRRSEVWLEPEAVSDDVLVSLIRVFMIYGQAGCTSPARVVLIDQPPTAALELRERLLRLWPQARVRTVAPHLASENIMARQWAAVLGWDARLAPMNQAVLLAGDYQLPAIPSVLCLPLITATLREAAGQLPGNIQTLGYAVRDPATPRWVEMLARTTIKRFVPLDRMHHFGTTWDGAAFWSQAFEMVEIGASR